MRATDRGFDEMIFHYSCNGNVWVFHGISVNCFKSGKTHGNPSEIRFQTNHTVCLLWALNHASLYTFKEQCKNCNQMKKHSSVRSTWRSLEAVVWSQRGHVPRRTPMAVSHDSSNRVPNGCWLGTLRQDSDRSWGTRCVGKLRNVLWINVISCSIMRSTQIKVLICKLMR